MTPTLDDINELSAYLKRKNFQNMVSESPEPRQAPASAPSPLQATAEAPVTPSVAPQAPFDSTAPPTPSPVSQLAEQMPLRRDEPPISKKRRLGGILAGAGEGFLTMNPLLGFLTYKGITDQPYQKKVEDWRQQMNVAGIKEKEAKAAATEQRTAEESKAKIGELGAKSESELALAGLRGSQTDVNEAKILNMATPQERIAIANLKKTKPNATLVTMSDPATGRQIPGYFDSSDYQVHPISVAPGVTVTKMSPTPGPPRSFGAAEIDALTRELGRKPTMAEIERKRQDMASAAQSPATLDALDARNKFYGARTLTETGGVKPEALGLHGVARPNLPPVQPTPVQPTATPAPPPPQPKPVTKVVGSSAIAPPRAKTEEASFTGISPTMDTVIDNYVDQISDNFDLANDPRFMQNKLHRTLTQQRFKQREGLPWPRAIPQRMKTAEEGADTDLATVDSIRAILKAHPEVSAFMGPIMGRTFEGVEDVASHVPILGRIGIPGIRKLGGAGIPNLPKNLELYAQQLSTMLTQLAASEAFVAGKGSIGQYLLNWVKENTASMNKNPQMFEGALRGIEDFAWAIHEGANRYRFPGKWTPSAKERYSSDVRHLGRETVPFKKQLPDGNVVDSSVWKHIQHIESGQRLVWDENKNTYVNEE